MLAFDLGIYNWIKTLHVLAAIVWVGGGIFIQIYVTRLKRANDQTRLMAFAKDVERFGTMVFLPASIAVLIFGIVMIWYAPQWEITQLWVIIGLLGIANTIVVGACSSVPRPAGSRRSPASVGPTIPRWSAGPNGCSRSPGTTWRCSFSSSSTWS